MKYLNTPLEDLIKGLYQKIGVTDANHPIEDIASRLGIHLVYGKLPFNITGVIVINPKDSKEKQKESFSHELDHELEHVGSQLDMPNEFRLMQEYRARNFAMHFAVPTHMLQNLDLPSSKNLAVDFIANTFGVTHDFADKRLAHYERQITGALFYQELQKCSEPVAEYHPKEIDVYGDLPYEQTPEFKDFISSLKSKGISNKTIKALAQKLLFKMNQNKTFSRIR